MGLVQGGMTVVLPPQLLLTVSVPEAGGFVTVIWPVTEYVLVPGLQAPGVAVNPVIVHKILQLVVPRPPVCENVIVPGRLE